MLPWWPASWTFTRLPSEFAPTADVGRGFIGIEAPEGSSFNYMDAYARQLEDILGKEMEKGDIERMLIRVPGQGGSDLRTGDVNTARGIVIMKPWHDRERSPMDVSRTIVSEARKSIPGVRASVGQPGESRPSRQAGSPVQAVIGGPDYDQLAQWSDKLFQLAQRNPGLVNVDTTYQERKPQLRVSIDRNRAADLGISLETVGRTLETVLGSRIVTTYIDRGREYNVILQGRDGHARDEHGPHEHPRALVDARRS